MIRDGLVRLEDWKERLVRHANSWRTVEYAYGRADCTRFAHGAVEAVTGVDILPGMKWPNGWIGAAKFMIAKGWDSVEAPMAELLPEMDAATSRPGDIVSYWLGGEVHLAVRVGDTALAPTTKGLMVVERSQWARAWKVG
jgi:hypothetical protein